MRFLCYNCYEERDVVFRTGPLGVPVHGETVQVEVRQAFCAHCQERMSIPEVDEAILAAAYRKYREAHEPPDREGSQE